MRRWRGSMKRKEQRPEPCGGDSCTAQSVEQDNNSTFEREPDDDGDAE